MSERKIIPVQYGVSATADFEENTWTFEMPPVFRVTAGEFAIIDKSVFNEVIETLSMISEWEPVDHETACDEMIKRSSIALQKLILQSQIINQPK